MVRASKFSYLFLSISVLALAACGAPRGVEANKTLAPKPPVSETKTNFSSAGQTPTTLTTIDESADPVIVPVNAILPESVSLTQEDRLARLEDAVNSLRNDYAKIMPAFAQLNVTNTRVQALLDQIDAERVGGAVAKPIETTTITTVTSSSTDPVTTTENEIVRVAETKMIATEAPVVAAAATEHSGNVQAVRLGEHPGKTRIVIDIAGSERVTPAFDLDNTEKLLIIDLPGLSTQSVATSLPKASGIIAGMTTAVTSNGSNLVVQLKKDAKILLKEYVKASGGRPAKLVFDVAPAS